VSESECVCVCVCVGACGVKGSAWVITKQREIDTHTHKHIGACGVNAAHGA
jgi:hypothetical protein